MREVSANCASRRLTDTMSGREPHSALDSVTPSTTIPGVNDMSRRRSPDMARSRPVAFLTSSAIRGLYWLKSVYLSATTAPTIKAISSIGTPTKTDLRTLPILIAHLCSDKAIKSDTGLLPFVLAYRAHRPAANPFNVSMSWELFLRQSNRTNLSKDTAN